ncbi:MAG: hypothetical protein KAW89_04395, partial [Armatimonadetes bacterium]|nr:hypothetical protein [Armatimonadota bacterium]
NTALGLLTEACLDRDPMFGQISIDPDRPQWLKRKGGGPFFMCGPGDPEGFLYRGDLRPDGTRAGDQMALIRKLAATGANCIYLQAIRSHGGDGDETHNPFADHDPAKGLNESVLDQWETWFAAMDEADIVVYLFIYDDSARIWNTGDEVGNAEREFIRALVLRFDHHRNLIWCVAEEYEERYSPQRVSNIATVIREADEHDHPIAVHKLHGLSFSEFAGDANIDQFAIQYNVPTAEQLHAGLVQAWGEARGRYSLNMSECADMGTGAELRKKLWASAMGGAYAMVLDMDIATTPVEDLYACGRLVRFMESTNFSEMVPHDELALGDTQCVLAHPGESYLAYAPDADTIGPREPGPGLYRMTWLDCATGQLISRTGGQEAESDALWDKPQGIGREVALYLERMR